ncbi:LysR family transcriptional regulator [Cupriavidus necator]|uniref:LysR family transcriptional regulator n=1 Tax=Cupriavidus necator TaxID=106590 RepID=UPI0009C24D0B|nr:LysR family transcriptional regulator [Cupriavidus necator]
MRISSGCSWNRQAALGLKLFTRAFDGFTPTDAAHELKPYAAGIAATAAAMRRVASGHGTGVRGTVRLSASEVIGVEVLPPILTALAARDPRLVRVLHKPFSLTMDTWVAMHEDLRESARCAVTFAALAAGLRAYAEGA